MSKRVFAKLAIISLFAIQLSSCNNGSVNYHNVGYGGESESISAPQFLNLFKEGFGKKHEYAAFRVSIQRDDGQPITDLDEYSLQSTKEIKELVAVGAITKLSFVGAPFTIIKL